MRRRNFLKIAGGASASTLLGPIASQAASQAQPKVYEVHDAQLMKSKLIAPSVVNKDNAKSAVDALARKMGNNADLGKAWQNLLPGITKTSKICIKVNCLKPQTSPQLCTLEAIIAGLKSMFAGTFPAKNIFLIDNNLQGQFKADHVNNAFGSANLDKMGVWHGKDSYQGPTVNVNGKNVYVSTKWDEAAKTPGTTCINFLCPRPHQFFAGYLSGHIKNMMGMVSTSKTTYAAARGPNKFFHNNSTTKYYEDLFKHVGPQTALYISDLLLFCKHENAYYDKQGQRLAFSNDPCAIDAYVVDTLNKAGYTKVTKKTPTGLQKAGLGSTNYQKVPVPLVTSIRRAASFRTNQRSRVTTLSKTRGEITFRVEGNGDSIGSVRITNSRGRLVRELKENGRAGVFHWNGKDVSGRLAASGVYFLEAGRGALGKISLFR